MFMYLSGHFGRSMHITTISVRCSTITLHLGFCRRRVHARDGWFLAGREERVLFEHRDREGFSIGAAKDSLGGKVKKEGVVVVELIQRSALNISDETKSVGGSE